MKRFLALSSGTLFFTLLGVFFTGFSVSAASPYDDVVQPVQEIYLVSPNGSQHQALTDWHSFITDHCTTASSNIDFMNDVIDNEQPFFIGVLSSEAYPAASTRELVAVFSESIGEISWKSSPARLSFTPTSTFGETLGFTLRLQNNGSITCGNSSPAAPQEVVIAGENPSDLLYTYPFLVENFDSIPYPPDYEGELIPEPVIPEVISPDFKYMVNLKDIIGQFYNQDLLLPQFPVDEGYTFKNYGIHWTLAKCESFAEYSGTCVNAEIINLQSKSISDTQYLFTVDEYGLYQLQLEYYAEQCFRYASYPSTPDHCFRTTLLGTSFVDGYDFQRKWVNLNIDGSSTSGDTIGLECSVAGFCEPPSPFEDCDLTDFGCHFRNFGTWLYVTIMDWLGFSTVVGISPFSSLNINMHGVSGVVTAPMSVYTYLANSNFICTTVQIPLPKMINKNLELPCMTNFYQTSFGAVFTLYQTIATGVVSYFIVAHLLRQVKDLNDPKNDKIQIGDI